jgi:hypothetical protein
MQKHQLIKQAHTLYKVAYQQYQPSAYMDQSWGLGDTAMAGLTGYYSTPTAMRQMIAPVTSTAGKVFGRVLPGLAVAGAGYGVYSSGSDMAKDYSNTAYSGQGLRGMTNYLGTSGGLNRLGDTVQSGSLTLAGTAIGAGIGSLAGGVGAIPGAAIGGIIGGTAEMGMHGYRNLTGWDGNKYQMARQIQQGNTSPAQAYQITQAALNNQGKPPMFQNKTWFGLGKNRDLMAEAESDVKKEQEFANSVKNPAPPTLPPK